MLRHVVRLASLCCSLFNVRFSDRDHVTDDDRPQQPSHPALQSVSLGPTSPTRRSLVSLPTIAATRPPFMGDGRP